MGHAPWNVALGQAQALITPQCTLLHKGTVEGIVGEGGTSTATSLYTYVRAFPHLPQPIICQFHDSPIFFLLP